jgi:hypothetical protein
LIADGADGTVLARLDHLRHFPSLRDPMMQPGVPVSECAPGRQIHHPANTYTTPFNHAASLLLHFLLILLVLEFSTFFIVRVVLLWPPELRCVAELYYLPSTYCTSRLLSLIRETLLSLREIKDFPGQVNASSSQTFFHSELSRVVNSSAWKAG